MNRSIALFVALAVLIAHAFAIHVDVRGALAPPYDAAYVPFRLGRMLAHEGELAWNPGTPGFDSHPSLLWVLLCALCERLYLPINYVCQLIGTLCALGTLILASRFHPNRTASLIAPLLLAVSGGMAAAAVSGTETAALTMFLTAAFMAFERKHSRLLGVALLLAGLTRPEAWLMGGALFVMRLRAMRRARRAGEPLEHPLRPFLLPLLGVVVVTVWRWSQTGRTVSTYGADLLSIQPGELQAGLSYVRDFIVTTGSPLLLVFPLWYLLRGWLSLTGQRALVLFTLWTGLVVLNGGGRPIYGEAMLPALPLALIAAQEGMIIALNSTRAPVRRVAWTGFLLAILTSVFASAPSRDGEPEWFADLRGRWTEPHHPARFGYTGGLGRAGLDEELATTAELRSIGIFLRDALDPGRTILTPWPGSIAYLSRLRIHDMLGRTDPIVPGGPTRSWGDRERVDLVESLGRRTDYVVPFHIYAGRVPSAPSLARAWLDELDRDPEDEARYEALLELLEEYELVTVPVNVENAPSAVSQSARLLLRRRDLGMRPELSLRVDEGDLVVELRHEDHYELADLWVRGVDARGRTWYLEPTGEFRENRAVLARSFLLVHPTGERVVELVRAPLPRNEPRFVELSAVLRTPRALGVHPWTFASEEAVLELR